MILPVLFFAAHIANPSQTPDFGRGDISKGIVQFDPTLRDS
jgi:hypothetical protein